MAMLDFLNTGLSGNVPINQNTMVNNTAGNAIGPTYGDLAKAAIAYGGSSPNTQRLGSLISSSQSSTIQPLQPTQTMKTPTEKNAETQDDSFSQIIGMLMQMFAV